jgi:hypothetical protein
MSSQTEIGKLSVSYKSAGCERQTPGPTTPNTEDQQKFGNLEKPGVSSCFALPGESDNLNWRTVAVSRSSASVGAVVVYCYST